MAKRILSIAMAFILMMNVFVIAVSATGEADYHGAFRLTADTTLPKRGDTVTVKVAAQTDYPVVIICAMVVYDSNYYEIVGAGKSAFTILQSGWPVTVNAVTHSPEKQYHPSYDAAMQARYKLAYISLTFDLNLANEGGAYPSPVLSNMTDYVSFKLKVKDTAPEDGKGIIWMDPLYERSTSFVATNATKLTRGYDTIGKGYVTPGYGQTIDYSEAKLFEPTSVEHGDFTTLSDLISTAKAKDTTPYTTESVAALNAKIEDAEALVTAGTADQATIDAMEADLQAAIDGLVVKPEAANYTAVDAAIARANELTLSNYTDATAKAVTDAIAAVVRNLDASQQSTVDGYAKAINDAIDALVLKDADYTAVDAAKTRVPADFPDAYTPETASVLQNALNAVTTGLDITKQAEVDAWAVAINNAVDGLVRIVIPGKADYSAVNAAIASKPADYPDLYTNDSVAAVEAAIEGVDWQLDETQQATVDGYAAAITAAIGKLAYKPADYTAVDNAKADIPADLTKYTDESVAVLNAALADVIENLNITHQAEVDAWAAAINAAIQGLDEKTEIDYSALQTLITQAGTIDKTLYTAASVATFETQLSAANEMVTNQSATTQADVDNMKIALQTAIDGLVAKSPADYTELNKVLNYFYPREDMLTTGIYKDSEIETLQALLDSYNMNLPSSEQSVVDGYVTELKAAIAALTIDETKAVASFDLDTDVAYAREGDSVKVSVKLKTNYPIYTMMIPVIYDGTVFQMNNTSGPVNAFLTFGGLLTEHLVTNGNWNISSALLQTGNSNPTYWNSAESKAKYKIAYATWTADFTNKSPVCVKLNEYETIVSFSMTVKSGVATDTVSDIFMNSDWIKSSSFAGGKLAVGRGVGTLGSALISTPPAHVDIGQTIDLSNATVSVTLNPSGADYTAVDAAIARANELTLSNYTDATAKAVTDAIAAVVRNLDASQQSTVDGYAKAINDAIDALVLKDADYTAVDDAIERTPLDLSIYTDESVQRLRDAVDAVIRGLDITKQALIDQFEKEINDAINALVLKPADYKAVDDALATIPENLSIYTDATRQEVEAARDAVVRGYDITKQSTVDGFAARIDTAVKALVVKDADYKAVDDAIANIPADLSIYTAASAKAVTDAKNAVVTGLDITHQDEVNAMAKAINDAIADLELLANYTAVDAAIARANELTLSNYTDATAKAVTDAIAAVVRNLDASQQSTVDGYAKAINDAIDALVLKGANYTAVDAAIARANELTLSNYTDATAKAVTDAIAAVVRELDITKQADVDAMAKAINDAIDVLVLKPADYKAVDDAIANIPADLSIYTAASAKAVTDARDAVVRNLDITNQSTVDGYAAAINAAVNALVVKDADYTAVNSAIVRADTFDLSQYTTETAQAVRDAIAAVVTGLKITEQARVDAMAKAINDAINGLVANTEIWGEWIVVTQPTCTEQGIERRTSNLGNTEDRAIAAVGHSWGEWVSNNDASFFVNGTETRTCGVCGATETRVDQGSAGYFDFVDGNTNWFLNIVVYIARVIVVATTWIFRGIEWYI